MVSGEHLTALVDYDGTLANTLGSRQHLWGAFADEAGVDSVIVAETSRDFYRDPQLGCYDFLAHTRYLGINAMAARAIAQEVLDQDDLYSDAVRFLDGVRELGLRPHILSYGEHEFQMMKIGPRLEQLGLNESDVTIVQEPKGPYIAHHFPSTREDATEGVLVDDRPQDPNSWPEHFQLVSLDRSGSREAEPGSDEVVVGSLDEALVAIGAVAGSFAHGASATAVS